MKKIENKRCSNTHSFLLLTTMTSFTFRGPLVILQISLLVSTGPLDKIFNRGMFSASKPQPTGRSSRHLTDIITFVFHCSFSNTSYCKITILSINTDRITSTDILNTVRCWNDKLSSIESLFLNYIISPDIFD